VLHRNWFKNKTFHIVINSPQYIDVKTLKLLKCFEHSLTLNVNANEIDKSDEY